VRGVTFTPQHLLDFAIRRFSAVMKWATVVLLLSSALIYLPLILATLPPFSNYLDLTLVILYVDHFARPALALFLIFFATVQIALVFHSESLRESLRDHLHYLQSHGIALAWFLLIAAIHFYAFHFVDNALKLGLGEGSAAGLAWQLIAPVPEAVLAAWLLASWVCLFKKTKPSHPDDPQKIAF